MTGWSRRNRRVTLRWTFACLSMGAGMVFAATPPAHADSWAWVQPEDNVQIMQTFANILADIEVRYGTGPLEVDTGYLGDRSLFAQAGGMGITVNKVWSTGSYEAMDAAIQFDVAAGYHNGGCDGVHTIALHEVAHVIDARRGWIGTSRAEEAAGTRPRPDLRDVLSTYSFDQTTGAVNPSEAVAEAFQAVLCGSASRADELLYEMLVN